MARALELMARAQVETSLSDFGGESFREGLDILLHSLDLEAALTEEGRDAIDAMIVQTLAQRLKIENWYRAHPEIDDEQIVAPLIGLGLPRTGSTAFHCLLAQDRGARTIRNWEALEPVPPPETATEDSDPRIERARSMLARIDEVSPRMKAMLPTAPDSPTECHSFQAYDFKTHLFQAQAQIPTYSEWLNYKADLVPTYSYVKRVLKLLQWRCGPKNWRLKNPSNVVFIEALNSVFPDARFWMTHRDVASVLPSNADLHFELMQPNSKAVDRFYIGRYNTEVWELGMRRLIAFRSAGHEHRFFDAHFAEFQRDPLPVMDRLYAFLGEDFTAETRSRMEVWRVNTPREKHGSHDYDPSDYDMDSAALRERFSFYHDRFGVLQAP